MTLLAELFDRLDSTPLAVAQAPAVALVGVMEVGASVLASEARQRPAAASQTLRRDVPAPSPTREAGAASEAMRNAWTITRNGRPICRMVGTPCTRTEALAEARWRWPDANVQGDEGR